MTREPKRIDGDSEICSKSKVSGLSIMHVKKGWSMFTSVMNGIEYATAKTPIKSRINNQLKWIHVKKIMNETMDRTLKNN